tara:strand:- start:6 stop:143 length:138 start_codon:yes stop_codon:yes gene_type:complete
MFMPAHPLKFDHVDDDGLAVFVEDVPQPVEPQGDFLIPQPPSSDA